MSCAKYGKKTKLSSQKHPRTLFKIGYLTSYTNRQYTPSNNLCPKERFVYKYYI